MTPVENPWALWARKTCTILLWAFGLGSVLALVIIGWGLLGDSVSVHRFFAKAGRLSLSGKNLDLSAVADVGQIRLVVGSFLAVVVIGTVAVLLVLKRLRNLLDEVLFGRPFALQSVHDLRVIGAVLLAASIAVPLGADLLEATAGAVVPGYVGNLSLTPDLTLLLCGFLVRTLAVIFAHGVRLQNDADLTV